MDYNKKIQLTVRFRVLKLEKKLCLNLLRSLSTYSFMLYTPTERFIPFEFYIK